MVYIIVMALSAPVAILLSHGSSPTAPAVAGIPLPPVPPAREWTPMPPADPHPGSGFNGREPAPMGIGDLGKASGGAQPGVFNTTAFRGTIDIGSADSYNSTLGTYARFLSFQLNAFLVFSTGGADYSYWVQDVALFNTTSRALDFEDNLWNVTAVVISGSAVSGNGTVSGTGSHSYYGDSAPCTIAGACIDLGGAANLTLELRTSLGAGGVPTVRVQFSDGGALETYDTVSFGFAHSLTAFAGFEVQAGLGFPGDCPRCFGDVELVVGGPGSGYNTSLEGTTNLVLSLDWWNGHDFQSVPDAVDHGEATEEGVRNAIVTETSDGADQPAASISYGSPGPLGTLWTAEDLALVEVTLVGGTGAGDLTLGGSPVPFVRGSVETLLLPGSEALGVVAGASTYPLGTAALLPGEALTLQAGGYSLVFVPQGLPNGQIWSVTLGGRPLNGTGNITFGEPSGSYLFTIGPLAGYGSSPSSGEIPVSGGGSTITIDWASQHPSQFGAFWSSLGPFAPLLIFLVVVLAGAAAASLALSARRRRGSGGY